MDGDPSEWANIVPVHEDGRDLPETSDMLGFDIDAFYSIVSNARRYVYIRLLDDWPLTTGAGAIDWKFIVDADNDDTEEFRLQKYGDWALYVREGDDVFAHRHSAPEIEYVREGRTAEFSFPATIDALEAAHPEFSFTGNDFRWAISTNQQQREIDGIRYFAP